MALEAQSVVPVPDAAGVPGRPDRPGRHGLDADHRPGRPARCSSARTTASSRCPRTTSSATATGSPASPGYESLNLATLSADPALLAQWEALQPPFDEEAGIYLRPISITQATQARSGYVYDEEPDAMVDTATRRGLPRRPVRGQLHLGRRPASRTGLAGRRSASTTTSRCSPTTRCDHGSCRSRRGRSSSPSPRRSSTSRSA